MPPYGWCGDGVVLTGIRDEGDETLREFPLDGVYFGGVRGLECDTLLKNNKISFWIEVISRYGSWGTNFKRSACE